MAKLSFNARMAVRFKKITSDYGKINLYVHETAIEILEHIQEHRNCATAQMLVNAMPQSARKLALITWFSTYSPILVKDDAKWTPKILPETDNRYVPFDVEAAKLNPWYLIADKMGSEKPAADIQAMNAWLETQAKAWEKKADDESKVLPGEALAAKALATALRAIVVTHVEAVVAKAQPKAGRKPKAPVMQDVEAQDDFALKAVA